MKSLIKVTTEYSLLESMIKIDELMSFCKENNISACGICDNNLFGVIEFYEKCLKNNIKPLIGLEIKVTNLKLYLYAKNYSGYQNLIKLNTIAQQREISLFDLDNFNDNLILIIPYSSIELFKEVKNIFKTIYIGYTNKIEYKNASLINDKVIFLRDIKSLNVEDAKYLNYLNMIKNNTSISNFQFIDYQTNAYNTSDKDDTKDFVDEINIEIHNDKNYIPRYDCEDSYTHLKNLTQKGLNKRLGGNITKEYQERLDYELSVIKKMGFVDYFLIVYDYVLYAKKNGILVGVGRGSAAGSLVSYTLGITDIDPIKYNLLFERFLNPERVTMPDIDIDFENNKRDLVINYVKNKYGKDKVAGIMTFGSLKSRLVLRSIAKCLEIDNSLLEKFMSFIDAKKTLKENLENPTVLEYVKRYQEITKAYKISMKLENLKRNISTNAAGVVICSQSLETLIPMCTLNDEMFTGVTKDYLENMGFLKMDFLAVKNLTTIANILETIKKDKEIKINLNKINLNDEKVFQAFSMGNTDGIFQFESYGMRQFLKKLKPNNFLDLTSAIALYRPGPMQNIDSFIRRKHNQEKIEYLHEDLKSILNETFGIIVYQEQIMQILVKIGGYTYAESDNIRRAMSKKKKEIIEKEKEIFLKRAVDRGYKLELAIKIYELILKFADYGFNKSHSVAYALIAYQMAYLKTYYPNYFYSELLNDVIGIANKTKELISFSKAFDCKIATVDINKSQDKYVIENNELVMPFGVLKKLNKNVIDAIIKNRKDGYVDFIDFVKKNYNEIDNENIKTLICADAFKNIEKNANTLLNNLEIVVNYVSLINDLDESLVEKPVLKDYSDFSDEEKRIYELENYGFYITNHPASKYNEPSIVKIKDIAKYYNRVVKFAVLIDKVKIIKTKEQKDMAFIDASDETGKMSFILFANLFNTIDEYKKNEVVIIKGRVVKRIDKYQVNITNRY